MIVLIHNECNTPIYKVLGPEIMEGDTVYAERIVALREDWQPPAIGSEPPFPCPNCGKDLQFGALLNMRQEEREIS